MMTRYFFHVRDGSELISDTEGVDLPNLEAATDKCQRIVREVLNENDSRAALVGDRQFEITNEQGRLVLVIPFLQVPLD